MTQVVFKDRNPTKKVISFLEWLHKEYYSKPELMGHPSWQLALEIEVKWPNFPRHGGYLELALFLAENGACMRCKKAFRTAWENYVGDVGQ